MKQTLEEAKREYIEKHVSRNEYASFGAAFEAGVKWKSEQSPWIKAKDQLPDVDENDVSEQSEPVLVILSAKGYYEPEILVYNKYYHVWDTADADDYSCNISDNDMWMPIPKFNE